MINDTISSPPSDYINQRLSCGTGVVCRPYMTSASIRQRRHGNAQSHNQHTVLWCFAAVRQQYVKFVDLLRRPCCRIQWSPWFVLGICRNQSIVKRVARGRFIVRLRAQLAQSSALIHCDPTGACEHTPCWHARSSVEMLRGAWNRSLVLLIGVTVEPPQSVARWLHQLSIYQPLVAELRRRVVLSFALVRQQNCLAYRLCRIPPRSLSFLSLLFSSATSNQS